ncbi:MAG: type II toxin-antitoxin system VapC family toxin [Bryobacterales bacterium]|nr:type II toxin-antitoxin system VapC family toxin [Bryobacterales bacterium]
MVLVVDASVAAKWLIAEPDSEIAAVLLDGSFDLHAPRLLASEIGNMLWRKARNGSIDDYEAARLAAALVDMPLQWRDDERTCVEAVRIAVEIGHPAYDCMYLALALLIGTKVVTADKRFVAAVESTTYRPIVVPLCEFVGSHGAGLVHMQAR